MTQSVMIEALSQRLGRKMRMIKIPMLSFGSAILRKAQASMKMTQKAAVGTVLVRLAAVICLAESSDFWKAAALMMSNTYRMQSAPELMSGSAELLPQRGTHPGHGDYKVIPTESVLLEVKAR